MPPKKKKAKITEAQENQMVDILQKAYTDDTLAVQWATEDSRAVKGTKRQAGTGMMDMEIADLLDLPDVKVPHSIKSPVLQLLRREGFHILVDVMSLTDPDWKRFVKEELPHFRPTLRIIRRRAIQAQEHDKKI
jgi:hypothetical protein